jgi:hypothetical protein
VVVEAIDPMSDIDAGEVDSDLPSEADEDDIPPPFAGFAAAAGLGQPLPEVRPKAGRPNNRCTLDDKLYHGTAASTQGAFVSELASLCSRFNASERMRRALHKMIGDFLPNFPSYDLASKWMLEKNNSPDVYPACVLDHYVHDKPVGAITPDQLRALLCPICKDHLAVIKNNIPYAKKVRSPEWFHTLKALMAANRC